MMELTLDRWQRATPAERETIAVQLSRQLPTGFSFDAIRDFELGGCRNSVAMYRFGDASFALIPGTIASLGFDLDRGWKPNPDELQSWRWTADEYGIGKSIQEYVSDVTLRVRQVSLAPFLIETAAQEVGWERIAADDSELREILAEHKSQGQVTVHRGDSTIRVRKAPDGQVIAERSVSLTHTGLAAHLARSGFRFPTSDEWEYACGGGATTLFRWGDHVPCDRYPTDVSPAEAASRRQWVLSGGKLERPAEGFKSDWDFHRAPNTFGLSIASNPYKYELVAEPGTTRGGDGGATICGGAGFFIAWTTLATAFFEAESCKHQPGNKISPGYTVSRRVLDLR